MVAVCCSEPDDVNVMVVPVLTCDTYFSGIENVSLIWLVFTNFAITVSGVTKDLFDMERNPIEPANGALMVVLFNWAAIRADSARADSKSALDKSNSAWLIACFSSNNCALL